RRRRTCGAPVASSGSGGCFTCGSGSNLDRSALGYRLALGSNRLLRRLEFGGKVGQRSADAVGLAGERQQISLRKLCSTKDAVVLRLDNRVLRGTDDA